MGAERWAQSDELRGDERRGDAARRWGSRGQAKRTVRQSVIGNDLRRLLADGATLNLAPREAVRTLLLL